MTELRTDPDSSMSLETRVPAIPATPRPGLYHDFARPELTRLMRAMGLEVTYVRAQGDRMAYDASGVTRWVVDMLGGYGAGLFGHHHPALVATMRQVLDDQAPIQAQASCRAWAGELAAQLSERIGRTTGRSYVVTMTNTGAEAIEAALKHAELERYEAADQAARRFRRRIPALLSEAGADQAAFLREASREFGLAAGLGAGDALEAIAQANARATSQPPVFFALERAFHGKTSGAAQVTYNPDYRAPFARIGVNCEFLPAHAPEAWERALARAASRTWEVVCVAGLLKLEEKPWVNVSAILIEPLQGEGGIHPLDPDHAAQIRALADRHGIPVIIDEIQSGMGRTGEFLASTACGLRGDYYTLSKSLGGGLTKIGALAVDSTRYCDAFGVIHTSTFAEDDMSARVALKALSLLDSQDLPARCAEIGARLKDRLAAMVAAHPGVLVEVRGRGLMLGLEFRHQGENPSNVIRMLSDQGYLGYAIAGYLLHEEGFRVAPTLSSATTIRLEPSALIAWEDLERFCAAAERLCCVLESANAHRLTRHLVGLAEPDDASPIEDFSGASAHLRREAPRCEKRVAFIGHFIGARDALLWDPSLGRLPKGAIEHYQLAAHRILGPTLYDQTHVTSAIGETVHLSFIGINLTSKSIEAAMRSRDTGWILDLIEQAVIKARDAGCQVVGLGGYTSIVADNGRRVAGHGLTVTTGNSLTVAMGIAALRRGAADLGIPLASACLGVLGAAGNIGSVYARMMAREVPRLVLVGREGGSRMHGVVHTIYADALARLRAGEPPSGVAAAIAATQSVTELLADPSLPGGTPTGEYLARALSDELGDDAPVVITSDLTRLRACRLLLTSSNSASPLVFPEHLHPEPVAICDLSVPADIADEVMRDRPDVLIIRGGLVAIPGDPDFRVGGIPLPPGHAFACMSETLLLGLMGVRDHFSFGSIVPEKVCQAAAWAEVNGFVLGEYKTDRSY